MSKATQVLKGLGTNGNKQEEKNETSKNKEPELYK